MSSYHVHIALWAAGIAVAVWLVRAVVLPNRVCRWCGGSGANWFSGNGRHGVCWFCRNNPRSHTFGARLVRRPFKRWRNR